MSYSDDDYKEHSSADGTIANLRAQLQREANLALQGMNEYKAECDNLRTLLAQAEAREADMRVWLTKYKHATECWQSNHEALRAALSTARAEAETMREAVEPLVKVLDEIEGNKSFRGIWPFLHVHGYVYTGPSYATELRDARAALQAHHPHGEEK